MKKIQSLQAPHGATSRLVEEPDHPPLQLLFMHLCLEEISMGVYRKVHRVVKYLKLKWMNSSIEHRELMLAYIKFKIEALLR